MTDSKPRPLALAALMAIVALSVAGCSSLGYYWQSASGHLQILQSARPVPQWLAQPDVPERTKERLALAARLRAFASRELMLPENASYHRYADLGRGAAVWNVVAAPALSLTLKTWCFPVVGCVGYRGYYDESRAQAEATQQRQQGLEAAVYPVPAYSTLGWFNWAGGDPLLNTFIHYPDADLARLIFHELAHQVVYLPDDTVFNESFASAVERLGVQRWLDTEADDKARVEYAQSTQRREQFRALTRATRERLAAVYDPRAPLDVSARLARKDEVMREFRARYQALRAGWGGDPARWRGTDRWVAEANNAAFGAQAAYDDLVPGFEALFEREGRDWSRFYDAVRQLGRLSAAERHRTLKEIPRA